MHFTDFIDFIDFTDFTDFTRFIWCVCGAMSETMKREFAGISRGTSPLRGHRALIVAVTYFIAGA